MTKGGEIMQAPDNWGKVFKSRFYRWVKMRPCVSCGRVPQITDMNEADHVFLNTSSGGKLRSHKGRFSYAVLPLCRRCHQKKHEVGEENFYRSSGVDVYLELSSLLTTFFYEMVESGKIFERDEVFE
jgi:hypothetical protein